MTHDSLYKKRHPKGHESLYKKIHFVVNFICWKISLLPEKWKFFMYSFLKCDMTNIIILASKS